MFKEIARELLELCMAVENPAVRANVEISRSFITVKIYIFNSNGELEHGGCYLISDVMTESSQKELEEAREHLTRLIKESQTEGEHECEKEKIQSKSSDGAEK